VVQVFPPSQAAGRCTPASDAVAKATERRPLTVPSKGEDSQGRGSSRITAGIPASQRGATWVMRCQVPGGRSS
jgi:hypothetical protein